MPNHITTIVSADRTEVIHALLTEDGVDFKRIVPPPDTETYNSDSCGHMSTGGCPWDCWYRWNPANWGTKWNAYDDRVAEDNLSVTFDTAWAHPEPVLVKLSEMFPEDQIRIEFADEDTGSNVGTYTLLNGERIEAYFPEYGVESCNLATRIKYGQTYAEHLLEWSTLEELREEYDEAYLKEAGVL